MQAAGATTLFLSHPAAEGWSACDREYGGRLRAGLHCVGT